MDKNKLVIIEGPQGTGKSTLSTNLRQTMSTTFLFSPSGHKDKTITGLKTSIAVYDNFMNYLRGNQYIPVNLIFDRFFTSEETYARLGYKDYSFTNEYKRYCEELNKLAYEIYYLNLYLGNKDLYVDRLSNRGEHHKYQAFSGESSMAQEEMYKIIADELSKYDNINVYNINTNLPEEQMVKQAKQLIRVKE